MAEEQQDFDSFALASLSVTHSKGRAPLWKFSEENPKVILKLRHKPRLQTQPVTTTLVKPLVSQAQTQDPAQNQPQAPAQAQLPQLAQDQTPQPHTTVPLFVRQPPLDLVHDEDRFSLDLLGNEASLIAKQAR